MIAVPATKTVTKAMSKAVLAWVTKWRQGAGLSWSPDERAAGLDPMDCPWRALGQEFQAAVQSLRIGKSHNATEDCNTKYTAEFIGPDQLLMAPAMPALSSGALIMMPVRGTIAETVHLCQPTEHEVSATSPISDGVTEKSAAHEADLEP